MAWTLDDEARLVRLRLALDSAIDGTFVTKTSDGSSSAEFAKPDVAALRQEIQSLETRKASGSQRGALRFRI